MQLKHCATSLRMVHQNWRSNLEELPPLASQTTAATINAVNRILIVRFNINNKEVSFGISLVEDTVLFASIKRYFQASLLSLSLSVVHFNPFTSYH